MNKKRALRPATEPIVFRPRSKPRLNFSSCTLNNDVLSLHHMTNVNLLSKEDSTIRTQITLTESLKQLVEEKANLKGQSLSEYIRRALMLSLLVDKQHLVDLEKLADQLIGSVNIKKNPQWRNVSGVKKWVKKLRTEWI